MLQELKKKKLLESLRGKPEAQEGEEIIAADPNEILNDDDDGIDEDQKQKIAKAKKLLGK